MPRYDGTGPRGQGARTGRGSGFCYEEFLEDLEETEGREFIESSYFDRPAIKKILGEDKDSVVVDRLKKEEEAIDFRIYDMVNYKRFIKNVRRELEEENS